MGYRILVVSEMCNLILNKKWHERWSTLNVDHLNGLIRFPDAYTLLVMRNLGIMQNIYINKLYTNLKCRIELFS